MKVSSRGKLYATQAHSDSSHHPCPCTGSSFGNSSVNTTDQLFEGLDAGYYFSISQNVTDNQRNQIAAQYPDDEDRYCPFDAGDGLLDGPDAGKMGRRSRGLIGDVRMVGPRRRVAEIASKKTTVYGESRRDYACPCVCDSSDILTHPVPMRSWPL